MNTKIIPIITSFSLFVVFFSSCEDATLMEYKGNAPVYMSYDNLRTAVNEGQTEDLKNPGKIYFKDNYIFIIEELKGIHVFDNNNPEAPVKKGFVIVPGVIDMAVSGNILYADSFIDLVVLDVQDVENINEVGRIKDILPYTVPPTGNELPKGNIDKEKGVVVRWEVKTIRERIYDNPVVYPVFNSQMTMEGNFSAIPFSTGVSSSGIGIGGSMARFGIKDKILFLLDGNTLKLLDINVKSSPSKLFEVNAGSGIETMFITGNYMFLGTTTGMIIYDITNPQTLIKKSTYSHMRSCDPVVVDDTLAYITLRSGTNCGRTVNCLDVVNIKNLSQPSLVKTYPMNNPYGLGKDGDLLFICDGNAGLKVFDASDPRNISIHPVYTYPEIRAYDVIPVGNVLILIGDDGMYQYNYSNVQNITLMSTISINKD